MEDLRGNGTVSNCDQCGVSGGLHKLDCSRMFVYHEDFCIEEECGNYAYGNSVYCLDHRVKHGLVSE